MVEEMNGMMYSSLIDDEIIRYNISKLPCAKTAKTCENLA